jgi:hypothetical protein
VITTAYSTKLCCLTRLRRTELLWSPVVATVAIIGKSVSAQKPQEQAKTASAGCDRCRRAWMVRRGSTVRVRQRALCKSPGNRGFLVQVDLAFVACAVGMEHVVQQSGLHGLSVHRRKTQKRSLSVCIAGNPTPTASLSRSRTRLRSSRTLSTTESAAHTPRRVAPTRGSRG